MGLDRLTSPMGSGKAVWLLLAVAFVLESGPAWWGPGEAQWHWQLIPSCLPLHPCPLAISLCPAMPACFCFLWRARLLPTPGLRSRTFLPLTPGQLGLSCQIAARALPLLGNVLTGRWACAQLPWLSTRLLIAWACVNSSSLC